MKIHSFGLFSDSFPIDTFVYPVTNMKFTTATLFSLFSFAIVAAAHGGNHHGDRNDTRPGHTGGGHGGSKNSTTPVLEPLVDDPMDETPGSGGDYVVLVDDEDPRSIEQLIQELGGSMDTVKYVYNNTNFKGFAASMSKHCVGQLGTFGGIKHYEEKAMFRASETEDKAPWGLNRISKTGAVDAQGKNALDLAFTYTFDENPGAGVDIYVVDTGIE